MAKNKLILRRFRDLTLVIGFGLAGPVMLALLGFCILTYCDVSRIHHAWRCSRRREHQIASRRGWDGIIFNK